MNGDSSTGGKQHVDNNGVDAVIPVSPKRDTAPSDNDDVQLATPPPTKKDAPDFQMRTPNITTTTTTTTTSRNSNEPTSSANDTAPARSLSFTSTRSTSFVTARRRMHEVDGRPLDHWNQSNFEKKRDESCRVVYEPKAGKEFYHRYLPAEDYEVMRSISLEQPYYSKYNRFFPRRGHFCCKACGNALYSYVTKFDAEDGWPAFGSCVEGAVGIIPSEKRKVEIEREDNACIKLQAFVRGALCRMKVTKMLEDMIQEMLQAKERGQHRNNSNNDEDIKEHTSHDAAIFNFKVKSPLFSPTTVKKKIGRTKNLRYTLLRAFGDDYTEIHCHRCKSHLGDVMAEDNLGRNGRTFRERHRVNGRSLKYVEDDLPKRINVEFSLLFADRAHRRLLGLPSPKKEATSDLPVRTVPFVSPRTKRRQTLSLSGIPSDPLSVTSHDQSRRGGSTPGRKKITFDPLSASCHESSETTRPTGRRGKVPALDIQARRASLEKFMLSKSNH
jgi:peptide methionine sulfoxide reductase MsrB